MLKDRAKALTISRRYALLKQYFKIKAIYFTIGNASLGSNGQPKS